MVPAVFFNRHHNFQFSKNKFRTHVFSLSLRSPWHTLATLCLCALMFLFDCFYYVVVSNPPGVFFRSALRKKKGRSDRARGQTVVGLAFLGNGKNATHRKHQHFCQRLLEQIHIGPCCHEHCSNNYVPGLRRPTSVTYVLQYHDMP